MTPRGPTPDLRPVTHLDDLPQVGDVDGLSVYDLCHHPVGLAHTGVQLEGGSPSEDRRRAGDR